MMQYLITFRNQFNHVAAIGKAIEHENGCILLHLDAITTNGELMLSPLQPKATVYPFPPQLRLVRCE